MEFKNRRGAFVVLIAVLFLAMIGVSAVAIDFSRMWALRNYLQTSADAGAMGGALQLLGSRNRTKADSAARAWADSNKAFGRSVIVDSVLLGRWNDSTRTFALGAAPNDAVTVVVADTARGLLMRAFGIAPPRLRTRAVGWAGAGITTNGCAKPWAIPMEFLMYAINLQRNIIPANSNANLTRPFDQILDVQALGQMSSAQRTFSLHLAANSISAPAGGYGPSSIPGPGNFQAVLLPIYWKAPSGPYHPYGTPSNSGTPSYTAALAGCNMIGVGDSLETKTGSLGNATVTALTPTVCATITSNQCLDSSGNPGVTIVAGFYSCSVNCQGKSFVRIELLGSFTLTTVLTTGSSKGDITGIYNPVQASGPVGSGPTTLFKPILVK